MDDHLQRVPASRGPAEGGLLYLSQTNTRKLYVPTVRLTGKLTTVLYLFTGLPTEPQSIHSIYSGMFLNKLLVNRAIRLTQVHTRYRGSWFRPETPQVRLRHRVHGDGLLNQAKEELSARARCPSVKSKRKFVEIVVQVGRPDRSLMGALQPSLQQGCHSIHQWQMDTDGTSTMSFGST